MREELDALKSLQRYFGQVLEAPWDVRTILEQGDPPERPYALVTRNGPLLSSGPRDSLLVTAAVTVHAYPAIAETMKDSEALELELRELLWTAVEYGHPGTPARHRRLPLWDYAGRNARQRFRILRATGGTYALRVRGQAALTAPIAHDADGAAVLAAIEATPDVEPGEVELERRAPGHFDVVHVGGQGAMPQPELEVDGADLLPAGVAGVETRTILEGAAAPVRGPSDFLRVAADPQVNTRRDDDEPRRMMVALDLRCTFRRGQPVPSGQTILQRIGAVGGPEG